MTTAHGAAPVVTVIAIGNPYRRDDGAGAAVLAGLAEQFAGDARVRLVELDGESVRLVQAWEGSGVVWLVDAVRSGRLPGSVHEVDATQLADLDD
ncbi:MAG: hydrogenase maturation protease, partial [Mycobacterium sp.]|nr:hydrogenase maturation protease [Mycobacterium sp.]